MGMHPELYELVDRLYRLSFDLLDPATSVAEYIREHEHEIEEPVRAALWAALDSFNTLQGELYVLLLLHLKK